MHLLQLELDPTGYNLVATFDGGVFELFGSLSTRSDRMRVLSVQISEPDENGHVEMSVNRDGALFALWHQLDESGFEVVHPLLDALRNASVAFDAQ